MNRISEFYEKIELFNDIILKGSSKHDVTRQTPLLARRLARPMARRSDDVIRATARTNDIRSARPGDNIRSDPLLTNYIA